jgi:tetratricopeptide (TPR) repeat protein
LACSILLTALIQGCASLRSESVRVSQQIDDGDAAHRASMLLVVQGLDADANFEPDMARDLYQRALQVDPANAYAYLAIARHRVEGTNPSSALPFLDKAGSLFEANGSLTPGVEAHLVGLRGAALLASGQRDEALTLLGQARRLEPRAWSDGRLDAGELR